MQKMDNQFLNISTLQKKHKIQTHLTLEEHRKIDKLKYLSKINICT